MLLNNLEKTTKHPKKRLGRGHGSGKVKTSGRGTKGQKARGKIKSTFEGGQLSLIKRLPLMRGRGRNKSFNKKPIVINLKYLNLLPKNTIVDIENLIKYGLVKKDEAKKYGVKILGEGELKTQLIIKLTCSKRAIEKIKKSGSKLENE